MVSTDDSPDACPDPAQLAAYIDGRVRAKERAVIQRHLADCEKCRETVADTVLYRDQPRGRVLPFLRRHKQAIGGGAVVLAASLLLVVVRPDLNPFRRPTPYEELVAAVGTNRTIEGRLSGGFQYGPLRTPTRSGSRSQAEDFELLGAVARIRSLARTAESPELAHALGVAHLTMGEYDAAIAALEGAASREPSNPTYLSDLSAAYLARGRNRGRQEDYTRALAVAERAMAMDADTLEAYYNRALALEALSQSDAARRAWSDYVSRDRDGGWKDEARRHMEQLSRPPPQ